MEQSLSGKVALVTGASKGIGQALAIGFAQAGANVVCAARSADLLQGTVDTIHANGGNALALTVDVTDETAVSQMLTDTVSHFGGLDVLLINAGGNFDENMVEHSETAQWRQTMELNLFGAYYCAKTAVPHLKARGGGKIITIGSGLGHRGMVGRSAYACSKAGLWMLTRVLAEELKQDNISVNELIPGPVDVGTTSEDFRKQVIEKQREWLKQPEDVMQLALFLATQPTVGPTAQSFSLMRRDN